jgi:hypothetical protein
MLRCVTYYLLCDIDWLVSVERCPSCRAAYSSVRRRGARPRWVRNRRPAVTRPARDWLQISVTALPGLAAVFALIFTAVNIHATDVQLQLTEQDQITDRYNAAIRNLGSPSEDVRLGGIYALQRIMQDSTRDQPTVVAVLCAFVRNHAPLSRSVAARKASAVGRPTNDLQAALTVVGSRDTAHEGTVGIIDFSHADLSGADLIRADLDGADLTGADLDGADLWGANLTRAFLDAANLTGAILIRADLDGASLVGANTSRAEFSGANLEGAFGLSPGPRPHPAVPRSGRSTTGARSSALGAPSRSSTR